MCFRQNLDSNIMKIVIIVYIGMGLVLYNSCQRLDRYNAEGLKNYFLKFLHGSQINLIEIECRMNPANSRAGYFLFKVSESDFKKMQKILNLEEVPIEADENGYYYLHPFIELQMPVDEFEFINPRYDLNDPKTWKQFPLLDGVKIYKAVPSLAPMKGNSRSSFKFLIYNKNNQECCVFLEYPYG